jgi:hypothetical protein
MMYPDLWPKAFMVTFLLTPVLYVSGWNYTVNTEKVDKIIWDNKDDLSTADAKKLATGGVFFLTWG